MASASLTQALGELVTCPICSEQYQDPRVLPCQHTYCRRCLVRLLAESRTISCPECRTPTQIRFSIDELKMNFHINRLLSVMANQKVSTNTKCSLLCEKHKESLKLFCEVCGELICLECGLVEHREHQFTYLKKILKDLPEFCAEKISKADEKIKKFETVLERVQVTQNRVNTNVEQMGQEIDVFIHKQIKTLEEKRTRLKCEVNEMTAEESRNLERQHTNIVKHLRDLKDGVASLEGIDTSINSEIKSMMAMQVICDLSKLTTKDIDDEIACDADKQKERVQSEIMKKHGLKLFEISVCPSSQFAEGECDETELEHMTKLASDEKFMSSVWKEKERTKRKRDKKIAAKQKKKGTY